MELAPPADLPRGATVLHLAGVTRGTDEALSQNVTTVPTLLKACTGIAARRLLFVSTAAVYAPGPLPSAEADPPAPVSPYGASKARAEVLLRLQDSVATTILRLGNVAGADALLGPRPAGEQVVLDPVPGRDGGPVRSWIGPRTLAQTLAMLCLRDLPPVLNIAQAPPLPMADLLWAAGVPWRYGPPNLSVVPVAAMDVSHLQSIVDQPPADPATLAAQAAWARGVLA